MTVLTTRALTWLIVIMVVAIVGTAVYIAVVNRASVRHTADILASLDRTVELMQAVTGDMATTLRLSTAEREQQHAAQINQLRRGQRCIIYATLAPTAAWTDDAIARCLRDGILPRGIGPR